MSPNLSPASNMGIPPCYPVTAEVFYIFTLM